MENGKKHPDDWNDINDISKCRNTKIYDIENYKMQYFKKRL